MMLWSEGTSRGVLESAGELPAQMSTYMRREQHQNISNNNLCGISLDQIQKPRCWIGERLRELRAYT